MWAVEGGGEGGVKERAGSDRSRRNYVKSRISSNAMWSKDEFWDKALLQCIGEAMQVSRWPAASARWLNEQ